MKVCGTCRIEKPTSEFHRNRRRKDGLQTSCKTCRKEIDRESYLKSETRQNSIKTRRSDITKYNCKLVRRIKQAVGCAKCPEREPVALDFHHLDPAEKDLNISSMTAYCTATLKAEIRKCVILCANCHRKVHAGILLV